MQKYFMQHKIRKIIKIHFKIVINIDAKSFYLKKVCESINFFPPIRYPYKI